MPCYLCEGKAMGANYSRVYALEGAKGPAHGLCAMAEIKRLEAENARLRAALVEIDGLVSGDDNLADAQCVAFKALHP